jgi:cob(I)alamin adenosyltransferase
MPAHEPGDRPGTANGITEGDAQCDVAGTARSPSARLYLSPGCDGCGNPDERIPERDERHLARMREGAHRRAHRQLPNECGLLLVLTGNGKGKSSSAFGMLARAMGHGMQCGVVQFIKGRNSTGEELFFRRFPSR